MFQTSPDAFRALLFSHNALLTFPPTRARKTGRESTYRIWTVRRHRDGAVLCVRETEPVVRSRLCIFLRSGIDLRISAGRVAVRVSRGSLVDHRSAKMVGWTKPHLTAVWLARASFRAESLFRRTGRDLARARFYSARDPSALCRKRLAFPKPEKRVPSKKRVA